MSSNVASFIAVTNSDAETAQKYLEFSGGDLESAITFFFESGGSMVQGQDDAALAEQLQQESYDVRPPDEMVRERLVEDDDDFDYRYVHNRAPLPFSERGIFNQYETDRIDEDDEDDEEAYDRQFGASSGLLEHQKHLGRLFRPPFDLIEKYTIDGARKAGREQKKWILLNIQDTSNFQCQLLNRDFWLDRAIKRVVREHFIFLQYQMSDYAMDEYIQFNQITEYPYIAILDPYSGERFKMWTSKVPDKDDWLEEVSLFLARYSLKPGHKNPTIVHKKKVDPSVLSEEQQLALAMRKSVGHQSEDEDAVEEINSYYQPVNLDSEEELEPEFEDEDEANDEVEVVDVDQEEEPEQHQEEEELSPEEAFAMIVGKKHGEPGPGSDVTRIQIRFGDGSRVVRAFKLSDTVRTVYEVLKEEYEQTKGKFFTLTCQRTNLIDKLDQTLQEAGLARASIMADVEEE